MAFNSVSPGVYSNEVDLSVVAPSVATTVGAIAGIFTWGPLFVPTLVTSENQLVQIFGKPNANNYETWFSAKNFLDYGDQLFVVRTSLFGAVAVNSTVNTMPNAAITAVAAEVPWTFNANQALLVTNATYNSTTFQNWTESGGPATASGLFAAAKYPGALGNSLRIGVCVDPIQYHNAGVALSGTITTGNSAGNSYNGTFSIKTNSNKYGTFVFTASNGSNIALGNTFGTSLVTSTFAVGDYIKVGTGNRLNPFQTLQINNISYAATNSSATIIYAGFTTPYQGGSNYSSNTLERYWEFYKIAPAPNNSFITPYQANSAAPTVKDAMNIVVVDNLGYFTGTPNNVLEVWTGLSRATDSVDSQNNSNYYQTVINQGSEYIYIFNDLTEFISNTAANLTQPSPLSPPYIMSFKYGSDGDSEGNAPMSTLINGWQLFQNKDLININLAIAGKAIGSTGTAGVTNTTYNNFGLADWLINNIAENRKDCVVFFSPDKSIVVNNNLGNDIPTDLVNWASLLSASNRAFMDCNYKYQYDQYNNVYRWVPLNGDIAGLCVYTDTVSYPWFSPAGFNRGQIQNVTRLAWNPSQGDRDYIYPYAINPVVTFPGQGTYLYGDKTFTQEPSAFDRINVRRMFLYIEKSIKIAAQYTLFEINDVFTQNQFINIVTPLLKAVQATRGITDFQVICNATNNTAQVVDADQFLCAVLIKPARSINFINITYYAVPDGVAFSTVTI